MCELLGTAEKPTESEEGRGPRNTLPRINIIQSSSRDMTILMFLPVFRV